MKQEFFNLQINTNSQNYMSLLMIQLSGLVKVILKMVF